MRARLGTLPGLLGPGLRKRPRGDGHRQAGSAGWSPLQPSHGSLPGSGSGHSGAAAPGTSPGLPSQIGHMQGGLCACSRAGRGNADKRVTLPLGTAIEGPGHTGRQGPEEASSGPRMSLRPPSAPIPLPRPRSGRPLMQLTPFPEQPDCPATTLPALRKACVKLKKRVSSGQPPPGKDTARYSLTTAQGLWGPAQFPSLFLHPLLSSPAVPNPPCSLTFQLSHRHPLQTSSPPPEDPPIPAQTTGKLGGFLGSLASATPPPPGPLC